jgi:hypothetical protein
VKTANTGCEPSDNDDVEYTAWPLPSTTAGVEFNATRVVQAEAGLAEGRLAGLVH